MIDVIRKLIRVSIGRRSGGFISVRRFDIDHILGVFLIS